MKLDDFIHNTGQWLKGTGAFSNIVMSSRIRLARNLSTLPFPNKARKKELNEILSIIQNAGDGVDYLKKSIFFKINELDNVDKQFLIERHLMSHEHASNPEGKALIVSEEEVLSIMINEEDHIRLQGMSPGMNLQTVWEKVNAVDGDLENQLDYAFSSKLGYLTACPSNVGTGLRASVMLHLSALKLLNEIEPLIKGLDKIGLAVRGLLGEGTEAHGNMFQISNQATLGETETVIIERLVQVVNEVVRHEENARTRLMQNRKTYVFDQIGRAFGILMHARVLSSREALDLLSGLRLGIDFNIVKHLTVVQINEIMILTQPGHLQKIVGRVLGPNERDEVRAQLVHDKLSHVKMMG